MGIKNFIGVFSRDTLPDQIGNNVSLIINTDKAAGQGKHWTCIYTDPKQDYVYYFDSYGGKPNKETLKYLKTSNKQIVYSSNPIQAYNTFLCGYFCAFFIIMMYRGMEPYDITYRFGLRNEKGNDDLLIKSIIQAL